MQEGKNSSFKAANYWKKALYSSVLLGAIFVGGQYVNQVQVKADSTNSQSSDSNKLVPTQIQFNDSTNGNNIDNTTFNAYVGQQANLVNTKIHLQDLGYDVSNIPDTYTPTSSNTTTYSVKSIGVINEPNNLTGKYRLIFEIRDQNSNYIESKYDGSDDSWYSNNLFDDPNPHFKKMMDELGQEKDKFLTNIQTAFDIDMTFLKDGDNVVHMYVSAPTHTLTINYINQDGVTVFRTARQVTNYGHTNFYDDQSNFNNDGIKINPNQPYVSNNQSNANVSVTTSSAFHIPADSNQVGFYDHGYSNPEIAVIGDPDEDFTDRPDNPDDNIFYTTCNFVGADGKNIMSVILSNNDSQMVSTSSLMTYSQHYDYDSFMNFANVTDMPSVIDLSKGPYTFHSKDTLASLIAASNAAAESLAAELQKEDSEAMLSGAQSASSSSQQVMQSSAQPVSSPSQQPTQSSAQSNSTPSSAQSSAAQSSAKASSSAAQPAQQTQPVVKPVSSATHKPTFAEYKSVIKAANKVKRSVNSDAKKLKALKKKMKKHANKKQKAAYKALQTKLSADKKAVNSYKVQEGKLTKYFKDVAIIKSDDKKIKSLTSQMKKLKKSHSKSSKKKYAKASKALKKANSSLKAATKFVNNYK